MSSRVSFLVLLLICCCALAGAATGDPAKAGQPPTVVAPAAVAPAQAPLPAWLQLSKSSKPSAAQSLAPSAGNAPAAPVFLSTCSNECTAAYHDCENGCAGDHDCILNCNNDWYCCLEACDGFFCD